MFIIKPYEEKYKADVQQVCINTGPDAAATDPKTREYILSAFCDYYVEQEGENALVLVDESDKAQGYILCAESFNQFRKNFNPYLRKIRKCGFSFCIEALGEMLATGIFAKKYPAHLHIDLNEQCRNGGYGSKMIEMLCENLKSKGICGIMLVVGSGNTDAIRFYKKNGFRKLLNAFGGTVMAKEL